MLTYHHKKAYLASFPSGKPYLSFLFSFPDPCAFLPSQFLSGSVSASILHLVKWLDHLLSQDFMEPARLMLEDAKEPPRSVSRSCFQHQMVSSLIVSKELPVPGTPAISVSLYVCGPFVPIDHRGKLRRKSTLSKIQGGSYTKDPFCLYPRL